MIKRKYIFMLVICITCEYAAAKVATDTSDQLTLVVVNRIDFEETRRNVTAVLMNHQTRFGVGFSLNAAFSGSNRLYWGGPSYSFIFKKTKLYLQAGFGMLNRDPFLNGTIKLSRKK